MSAVEYARQHRERFVEDLKTLIRIPSISTLPEHREDVRKAAEWLRTHLGELGFSAEIIALDGGHPLLYGEWMNAPDKPTVLIYGHFDVQPVDPLREWTSPPFEPTVRGDNLYARGASDNKGQLFGVLKALEALMRTNGRLPLNVRLLFEGEEEIGSPGVYRWIDRQARRLACNFAWVSDGQFFAQDLPTIVTGLRGLVYTEVEVRGASHDLHSGQHGGPAPNPVNALAAIIAGLKDRRGRVTVPRFYAAVQPPSPEERASWERLPFREADYLRELGVPMTVGEQEYGILERRWVRPTLDAHGIAGGWTGAGAKTVIPARALAKVSMRLVPDQRAATIFRAFERKVKRLAPPGVEVDVRELASADAVAIDPSAPVIQTAAAAVREVWGRDPVYTREGGSIPIVVKFARVLKVPTVLFGFGLPDDNLHAPNEKFYLPNFYKGIETVITFLQRVGGESM